jgi:antitoxin component YwqK of YwqJK toxin-antitoxin module
MKAMFKSSLTKMTSLLFVSALFLLMPSCRIGTSKKSKSGEDLSGLVLEAIPGTTVQYARQIDSSGFVQIEGYLDGGKKTGQWIEYQPDGDIMRINNYVNGMLEGTAMKMTYRNQVDLKLRYHQNEMDGPYTAFKFGKIIEERNYKAGKLDGTVKVYDDRAFKLKQETQFKDGLQDGYLRYYDDSGNVTLEYIYKHGEKVSGGIVEPKK